MSVLDSKSTLLALLGLILRCRPGRMKKGEENIEVRNEQRSNVKRETKEQAGSLAPHVCVRNHSIILCSIELEGPQRKPRPRVVESLPKITKDVYFERVRENKIKTKRTSKMEMVQYLMCFLNGRRRLRGTE